MVSFSIKKHLIYLLYNSSSTLLPDSLSTFLHNLEVVIQQPGLFAEERDMFRILGFIPLDVLITLIVRSLPNKKRLISTTIKDLIRFKY